MNKKMTVCEFKKDIASVLLKIKNKKYVDTDTLWVCDRDPHENIKRQLKIYKEVGDNLCVNCEHFADAIEEDIENTEGE